MEFKTLALDSAQIKFAEGSARRFTGYASTFGGVDSHGDTIHPGAFKSVLARSSQVKLYYNHGWLRNELPVGLASLEEDAHGLKVVDAEFTPGLKHAEDVALAVAHKTVNGLSIGYRVDPTQVKNKSGGGRDIYAMAALKEVSVVDFPSDADALIDGIKAAIHEAETLKEIESLLRDAGGFSRTDACALVARIKSMAHGERDAEAHAAAVRAAFQQL